jgi:hypothetical protein
MERDCKTTWLLERIRDMKSWYSISGDLSFTVTKWTFLKNSNSWKNWTSVFAWYLMSQTLHVYCRFTVNREWRFRSLPFCPTDYESLKGLPLLNWHLFPRLFYLSLRQSFPLCLCFPMLLVYWFIVVTRHQTILTGKWQGSKQECQETREEKRSETKRNHRQNRMRTQWKERRRRISEQRRSRMRRRQEFRE